MRKYEEIEGLRLPNGMTVEETNNRAHGEVERIYLGSWAKGVAVPHFDAEGNIFLANPDGSDDAVELEGCGREYKTRRRVAEAGSGRMSYLLRK